MKKYLVIQTASIGDVILSTAIGEKLKSHHSDCQVDYLIKQGNEGVFYGNMNVNEVIIWNKKTEKYKNMLRIIFQIRDEKYDAVINLQRFLSSGIFTIFSGAKKKFGFRKNPLSLFFSKAYPHNFRDNWHEIDRNQQLISTFTNSSPALPKLYPTKKEYAKMSPYKTQNYITITPASLWFTKQFPKEKWIEFINYIDSSIYIYFLGGSADKDLCKEIMSKCSRQNLLNFAGKLSFVESAALMRDAMMNYVNDSAAQHIASSVDAKISTIYCSTVPEFGFGPLSSDSVIIQSTSKLNCRPCGIHGHKTCPKEHFKCGLEINIEQLLNRINNGK